jgi:hypothetical protein
VVGVLGIAVGLLQLLPEGIGLSLQLARHGVVRAV